MLTSKQRAYLKGLAMNEDTILQIGKGGMSENVVRQADGALEARELVKGKVLDTSPADARTFAERLAGETKSELVQVIGSKFVLYRRNRDKPKIELPKAKKP